MKDILTAISTIAFGGALLASIIIRPDLWVVWGVRVGFGALLFAIGWEVASGLKGR